MLAAEIIRTKRDGGTLSSAQIDAFVHGLVAAPGHGAWSEGQVAALAMAVLLRGMGRVECVSLTRAMTASGEVLNWAELGDHKPVLDKHSTGGVGDKVSLMLAPIVAACGGLVPMISGRGLGHTGGTLDKLAALPGYTTEPTRAQLLQVLRQAGCAIIGASSALAPADRRLYAVRDVTATIESVPLITASILSKKLAAGLQGLVLDVKLGNGAFMQHIDEARALASSLVQVAAGAGLLASSLITDMNQVLGHSAGNALEVQEAMDFLSGESSNGGALGGQALSVGAWSGQVPSGRASSGTARDPRLLELTLALCARVLHLGGLANSNAQGRAMAHAALDDGRAAEAFARMVAGLGGPRDVFAAGAAALPIAPVQRDLPAPCNGVLARIDTRAIGLAVLGLGGGRQHPGDALDPRVGFSHVLPLGRTVQAGEPLLRVHAASAEAAETALRQALAAITLGDTAQPVGPVVLEQIDAQADSP